MEDRYFLFSLILALFWPEIIAFFRIKKGETFASPFVNICIGREIKT